MTPDELDDLAVLAADATPGPRTARRLDLPPPGLTFFGPSHWNVRAADPNDPEAGPQFTTSGVHSAADAAFIAACDPDTIRRLILAAREPAGAGLREAAERVVTLLLTSGREPPPLNDSGLLSTLHYYAGPNARTAVDPVEAARVTALSEAAFALRAALSGPKP